MRLSVSKISITIFFMFVLTLCVPVKEAVSCENDCKYERQRFITEQMIKHKMQERYTLHFSPVLIGADALFL